MNEILLVEIIEDCGGLYGYVTEHSAGNDLMSRMEYTLMPDEMKYISTGIKIAVPEGFYGMIASRSGIGTKKGIIVAQGVGIVDADYRGEVFVPLYNRGHEAYHINAGERIAQLLICPVIQPVVLVVRELGDTTRGSGGFGSTG